MDNYRRFWIAFGKLDRGGVEREELKAQLVRSFTDGRTESLTEMTDAEYAALCKSLEERNGYRDELRFRRSCCLSGMQVLGINTQDWSRVNAFCRDRRIAGKVFARLTIEELKALDVKLRAIERRGGLKSFSAPQYDAARDDNNKTAILTINQNIRDYGKSEENGNQWCVEGSC